MQAWQLGPALPRRPVGSPAPLRPNCRWICRRYTDEALQDLADLAEVQAAVEVLDEIEDVTLRLTERVPPAAPVMDHYQDLALVAAVFQGPPADHALQNSGTVHTAPKQPECAIINHGTVLPGLFGAAGCAIAPFPTSSLRDPATAKPEGCKGAASAGGGRAAVSLAARPAQAVAAFR
jgi:hypothetical protein